MRTKFILFFALIATAALAIDNIEDDDVTLPPVLAPFMNAPNNYEELAANLDKRIKKLLKATPEDTITKKALISLQEKYKQTVSERGGHALQRSHDSSVIFENIKNSINSCTPVFINAGDSETLEGLRAPSEAEVSGRAKKAIERAMDEFYECLSEKLKTQLLQAMLTDDTDSLLKMGSEPLAELFLEAGGQLVENAGEVLFLEENPSIMVAEPVTLSGWQRFVAWLKSLFGIKPQKIPLPDIQSVQASPERNSKMGDRIQAHFQARDEFFKEIYELYQPFHNMFAIMAVQVDKLLSADIEPQDADTPENLENYYKKISDNLFHGLAWLPVLAKYRRGGFAFNGFFNSEMRLFRKISQTIESKIGNGNQKLFSSNEKIKRVAHWRLFWDFVAFLGEADQGIALRLVNEVFSCTGEKWNGYKREQQKKVTAELIKNLPPVESLRTDFSGHAMLIAISAQYWEFGPELKVPEFGQRARDVGKYVSIEDRPLLSAARVSKLMYARALLNPKGYQMFDLLGLAKATLDDNYYGPHCGLKLFAPGFDRALDQSLTDDSLPQAMRDNYVALKLLNLWSVDSWRILEKGVFQAPKDDALYAKWAESLAKIDPKGKMLEALTPAIKDMPAAQASGMSAEQKVKLLAGVELSLEQAHQFEPELSKLFQLSRSWRFDFI